MATKKRLSLICETPNFGNAYLGKVTKFQGYSLFRFGVLSNLLAWRWKTPLPARYGMNRFNPPGTKGFGTHTKHQGGGGRKGPPSISRTRNATNLKPLEGLGVSFKVSKNFKLV